MKEEVQESANKLYYSMSDISKIIDEKQHVLRYWEKSFPFLKSRRFKSGKKHYTKKNLELFKLIKKLIRENKYTVKGARITIQQQIATKHNYDSDKEVKLSKKEFAELIEILQLMMLYMKKKK